MEQHECRTEESVPGRGGEGKRSVHERAAWLPADRVVPGISKHETALQATIKPSYEMCCKKWESCRSVDGSVVLVFHLANATDRQHVRLGWTATAVLLCSRTTDYAPQSISGHVPAAATTTSSTAAASATASPPTTTASILFIWNGQRRKDDVSAAATPATAVHVGKLEWARNALWTTATSAVAASSTATAAVLSAFEPLLGDFRVRDAQPVPSHPFSLRKQLSTTQWHANATHERCPKQRYELVVDRTALTLSRLATLTIECCTYRFCVTACFFWEETIVYWQLQIRSYHGVCACSPAAPAQPALKINRSNYLIEFDLFVINALIDYTNTFAVDLR